MPKNLFDMQHITAADTGLSYQIAQRFTADTEGDILTQKLAFAIGKKVSLVEIISKIKSHMTAARAVSPSTEMRSGRNEIVIVGEHKSSPALMFLNIDDHPEVHDIKIELFANPEASISLKDAVLSEFEAEKLGMIKWWFIGEHSTDAKEIYLPPLKTTIRPEFYPDLGNPQAYIADYMASEEAILLMAGPPGTGKTTLLRHLIADYKLSAHVIYDEALMKRDNIFQSFLFDDRGDAMIIEDADTILTARESDGNKLMSRFLNVSDGLIKLPNKKLIFTTNITDFGKVDQALLRPGRCFGVMHTRPLNLTEAQAAARAANLAVPIEKREYTIAELFNQGKSAQVRKIGFGVRH